MGIPNKVIRECTVYDLGLAIRDKIDKITDAVSVLSLRFIGYWWGYLINAAHVFLCFL